MARALSDQLELPALELDSIFHQPDWQPKPDDLFREEVAAFVQRDRWIVDGNYTSHGVAQLVWPKADTIVWMDLPRRVIMPRVVGRTLRRVVTREELWNGNREPWTNLYSTRPEENIIVWAWTRFADTRRKYEGMAADGTWSHLTVIRLRSPAAVRTFLRGAPPAEDPTESD